MPISAIPQHMTPVFLPGRARHRVKIVQPTEKQDSTGGTNVTEDMVIATVWASIEAMSATDKFAAHEFINEVTHQVVIRWRPGITAKMRIVFKTRLFLIEGVQNPDERNKMLILLCLELPGLTAPMGG